MKIQNIRFWVGILALMLAVVPGWAQPIVDLQDFTNTPDGASPEDMVLANGVLYGSTRNGGASNNGTLFYLGTNGVTYVKFHDFGGAPYDGASPNNIIVANNGVIYGTTYGGSTNAGSYGTIFRVDTNGNNYTILRAFTNAPDGSSPLAGLTLAGTNLYGTASTGGTNGDGIVFCISTNGAFYTVLHTFTNSPDGLAPQAALTLLGTNLYGTTKNGGSAGEGVIFQLSTNGSTYNIIHNFTNGPADGAAPMAAMIAVSNVLYGTTSQGGSNNGGIVFSLSTNGANYSVLAHLSGFSTPAANNAGIFCYSPLTYSAGRLYGEAYLGGLYGNGTIFQLGTNGANFMVLKNFTNAPDGNNPRGALTIVGGAILYGSTDYGGSNNGGMAYALPLVGPSMTLQPQDVAVTNGYPSSFSALAAGEGTLNYQWYFRTNSGIANAIATTYSITNTTTNNIGTYNVIVTNYYGSVTSSYATLSIISTPVLLNFGYDKSSASFGLTLAYTPTATNRIWASTNLTLTNYWHVIATNKMGTNGLWFFSDSSIGKTNPVQFYRYSTP